MTRHTAASGITLAYALGRDTKVILDYVVCFLAHDFVVIIICKLWFVAYGGVVPDRDNPNGGLRRHIKTIPFQRRAGSLTVGF